MIIMKDKKQYTERKVDVNNFRDVRNTASSLKVTPEELKEAIKKVGPGIDTLRAHLKAYHNPYLHRYGKSWHL